MKPPAVTACSLIAALLPLLLPTTCAQAHEYWVQPTDYAAGVGELLKLQMFHGERFEGSIVPRNAAYIRRFELVTPEAEPAPVVGRHGSEVSFVRVVRDGRCQIVFESEEIEHWLPADKFEAYLAEEKLDSIIEARLKLGESDQPGREVYVRCSKALIDVDGGSMAHGDVAVELPLEIVIEELRGAGDRELGAIVLFQGQPLCGIRVVAVSQANPERLIECTTDTAGRVRITTDTAGPWMLTVLHMVRVSDRVDVDWKSFWASTTLELKDQVSAQPLTAPNA